MKRLLIVILAAMVAIAVPTVALADSFEGKTWNVTYTSSGNMDDDYSFAEYSDQISQLQPGDDITLKVVLHHDNDKTGDWYLRNDVIKSLEDASNAAGSAYTYKLDYAGPATSRNLFDSTTIGGDSGDGLHDADDALSDTDYIYLDKLTKGQTATVTLYVALDGETESNAYFDTLAQVKLGFAVEPEADTEKGESNNDTSSNSSSTGGGTSRNAVKTGDETRLFPFYVAMLVSGILFAGLAVVSYRERKKEEEEVQR